MVTGHVRYHKFQECQIIEIYLKAEQFNEADCVETG